MTFTHLVYILICIFYVDAFFIFQRLIPNGNSVPSPWKQLKGVCGGVGHCSAVGGGPVNPFGFHFNAVNKEWTETLCRMDSDGDGQTNGEELGDPDCIWKQGDKPSREAIGHPGVCEPVGSELCKSVEEIGYEKNEGRICQAPAEASAFCPASTGGRVKPLSLSLSPTTVPPLVSSLYCTYFTLPRRHHHIVAIEPALDNVPYIHHIATYGCRLPSGVADHLPRSAPITLAENDDNFQWTQSSFSYDCTLARFDLCKELLGDWTIGHKGDCFPQEAGILVGGEDGLTHVLMEMHWVNPREETGLHDASGLIFHLTEELRPHNLGFFVVGQYDLVIPPQLPPVTAAAVCTRDCMKQKLSGVVHVVSAMHHMHSIGHSGQLSVRRQNGSTFDFLLHDDHSDLAAWHFFSEPVPLYPDDEILVSCTFSSKQRKHITAYGSGADEEMCYGFLYFYPIENSSYTDCFQFGNISECEKKGEPEQFGSCDVTEMRRLLDHVAPYLLRFCQGTVCRQRCYEFLHRTFPSTCLTPQILNLLKTWLKPSIGLHYQMSLENIQSCVLATSVEKDSIEVERAANALKSVASVISSWVSASWSLLFCSVADALN